MSHCSDVRPPDARSCRCQRRPPGAGGCVPHCRLRATGAGGGYRVGNIVRMAGRRARSGSGPSGPRADAGPRVPEQEDARGSRSAAHRLIVGPQRGRGAGARHPVRRWASRRVARSRSTRADLPCAAVWTVCASPAWTNAWDIRRYPQSYRRIRTHVMEPWGIDSATAVLPPGMLRSDAATRDFERRIRDWGGVDLQILGWKQRAHRLQRTGLVLRLAHPARSG